MLKHLLATSVAALVFGAACTNERTPTSAAACLDYTLEIQPVLERACLECHGPALLEGDYSVATPADTFARRPVDGTARIEANNDALFLAAARGANDHPAAEAADLVVFERWLVTCEANTVRTEGVHPRGWLNRDSTDFHGATLQSSGWDFDACGECHGAPDDGGGPSGIACTTCHTEGATSCSTCHGVAASEGAPGPALDGSTSTSARGVGAHRIHLDGRLLASTVPCADCHIVPEAWDDPGHIFTAEGDIDETPAEVVFGGSAGRNLEDLEERRTAEPSYDADTGTCSNVYCHAAVVGDTTYTAPVWTDVSDEAACDICHGLPPGGTHPEGTLLSDCVRCHPQVVGAETGPRALELLNEALHIDGRLSLADGNKSCSGCHGSATNDAPPVGVGGETSTDDPQVGGHQVHLSASTYRGPIACGDCHALPVGESFIDAVIAPGHLDTLRPAEVFPDGAGGLAGADDATPSYTRPNCSNAYCHGGGTGLSTDTTAGIVRSLDWTDVGNDTVVCGACHGLPPDNGSHLLTIGATPITRTNCYLCHFRTIDESGNIVFDTNGNTEHIDGRN